MVMFGSLLDCCWTHLCAKLKPEPTFLSASDFVISTFTSLIQDRGASSGIEYCSLGVMHQSFPRSLTGNGMYWHCSR